jgi:hypothetical protein
LVPSIGDLVLIEGRKQPVRALQVNDPGGATEETGDQITGFKLIKFGVVSDGMGGTARWC